MHALPHARTHAPAHTQGCPLRGPACCPHRAMHAVCGGRARMHACAHGRDAPLRHSLRALRAQGGVVGRAPGPQHLAEAPPSLVDGWLLQVGSHEGVPLVLACKPPSPCSSCARTLCTIHTPLYATAAPSSRLTLPGRSIRTHSLHTLLSAHTLPHTLRPTNPGTFKVAQPLGPHTHNLPPSHTAPCTGWWLEARRRRSPTRRAHRLTRACVPWQGMVAGNE